MHVHARTRIHTSAGSATYIAVYALLRERYGVRTARLAVTLFHCAVTMYSEVSGQACDPAAGEEAWRLYASERECVCVSACACACIRVV
jgi:hypothetical protein